MATTDPVRGCSRSKKKRLNKKAKDQRIAEALTHEKQQRELAERTAKHWRQKATQFRKRLDERDLVPSVFKARGGLQSRPMLSSSVRLNAHTIAKATPSLSNKSLIHLPSAPMVNSSKLAPSGSTVDCSRIGEGRFGSCTRMIYQDMFKVCVKKICKEQVSIQAVKNEAAILCTLNTGGYTPHCFGVSLELHAIVMSYVSVADRPVTLFSLLYDDKQVHISRTSELRLDILIGICKGIQYIHNSGFLHNDLKLDNVVIGDTLSGKLKPFIIDLGKACQVTRGKKYSLSEEDKKLYKIDHPQVAPDLRDGLVEQSMATDIYSLGRILKRCNSIIFHSKDLTTSIRPILSYHSEDRPSIQTILSIFVLKKQSSCV